MSEALSQIISAAEQAVTGGAADRRVLERLTEGISLAGPGEPEGRAYLAVLLDWLGLTEQAMLALRPADGERGSRGAETPNLAGMLAAGHGDYEQAREWFQRALSAAGDNASLRARILVNLAALSLRAGEAGSASDWLAQAGEARVQPGDPATDVLLAATELGLARTHEDLPGQRAAVSRLNVATRARVAELGPDHPLALTAVASLAAADFELAAAEGSSEDQERAIAVLEIAAHRLAADLGADHPLALACLEDLCVADLSLALASRSMDRATRAVRELESLSGRTTAAVGAGHSQARRAIANAAVARQELEVALAGGAGAVSGPRHSYQAEETAVSQHAARRHILETWRAAVDYCYRDGKWEWGGRTGSNSISDAEQLLTILYPATAIDSLRVDSVDHTAGDVLDYLSALGNAGGIPRLLIGLIGSYLRTYQVDGTPDFSGGTCFEPQEAEAVITPGQRRLHVVDSFATSVTLCLSALGFLRIHREGLRNPRMVHEVDQLETLASQRLTAAMVGLLRSFTVNAFDPNDPPGQALCTMINQGGVDTEVLVRNLLDELTEIRDRLRQGPAIGIGRLGEELEDPGRLFECGWSWGIVEEAPEVPYATGIGEQPAGVAEARPSLYFTAMALDGIEGLFSERTRVLGLLNEEQQRLARALQSRGELTRRFWAKIATFGGGRWPLEDLPWMTTDGQESDYSSVLLTSILIGGAGSGRVVNVDIDRIGRVLEELANRGRITRRPMAGEPAIGLHMPGMRMRLIGSEKAGAGLGLSWTVSSYTLLVLKLLFRLADLLDDRTARKRYLDLADVAWRHVERRRIDKPGARGLWDNPAHVFTGMPFVPYDIPSWHHTERVVEALVAAASMRPRSSATDELLASAEQLVAEAEHLYDRELLRGTNDAGAQMRESLRAVAAKLARAREILRDRPGTASVLAGDVLRELDMIEAARQDARG